MSPRGSQRVDRRRRVLVDESRNEQLLTRPRIFRSDDDGPLSRYNESALRAINAPIASYLPFRQFTLCVWFLVGLIPILGLMLLDQRRFVLAKWLGEDALRIFDMRAHGSLASWCASLAFALVALLILAIYSVRRHRRDDYRAKFAVWQWILPVAILASVDSVTGLHNLVQGAISYAFGHSTLGNGAAWWVAGWAILIGLATFRLSFEMSASRKSIAWMIAGTACYLWCGAVQLELTGQASSPWAHSSQLPLLLLGHHFTLFSLVSYARDVIREAMGLVDLAPVASPKAASPKAASPKAAPTSSEPRNESAPRVQTSDAPSASEFESAADEEQQETLPLTSARQSGSRRIKASSQGSSGKKSKAINTPEPEQQPETPAPTMKLVSQDGEEQIDMSKLSRSERKRMKKELRRKKAA